MNELDLTGRNYPMRTENPWRSRKKILQVMTTRFHGGMGVESRQGSFARAGANSRLRLTSLVTFDREHATASNETARALLTLRQRFFLGILSAGYQPGQGETNNLCT